MFFPKPLFVKKTDNFAPVRAPIDKGGKGTILHKK